MPKNINDGSDQPPRLKVYLNIGTLTDLPSHSIWPKLKGTEAMAFLKKEGFEGVQDGNAADCRAAGIASASSGRIDSPAEAKQLAQKLRGLGHEAGTVHIGCGFEDDATMDALVRATVEASDELDFPLFIETHRATITQDVWRTIQMIKRVPSVRFNGDFSHYYTGHELPYGDLEAKWRAMQPIFDRVGFMHGRIGNTSCMQVNIADGGPPVPQVFGESDFLAHHREMWTRAMHGFLKVAKLGDYLVFAPEILSPAIYYARKFTMPDGTLREESDRYAQALVYARIARECFEQAKQRL
jgi:hypothetical protein